MQDNEMRELTDAEIDQVSGGMSAYEGAGLILGFASFAVSSPIVVGVAVGAAGGLIAARMLARTI